MGNTDLTKFNFSLAGYIVQYFEGDLVETRDELARPYIAPLTYITMCDGKRTWVLRHVFKPRLVSDEDGAYMESGRDQALAVIAKIFKRGTVDLTKWETWSTMFPTNSPVGA